MYISSLNRIFTRAKIWSTNIFQTHAPPLNISALSLLVDVFTPPDGFYWWCSNCLAVIKNLFVSDPRLDALDTSASAKFTWCTWNFYSSTPTLFVFLSIDINDIYQGCCWHVQCTASVENTLQIGTNSMNRVRFFLWSNCV